MLRFQETFSILNQWLSIKLESFPVVTWHIDSVDDLSQWRRLGAICFQFEEELGDRHVENFVPFLLRIKFIQHWLNFARCKTVSDYPISFVLQWFYGICHFGSDWVRRKDQIVSRTVLLSQRLTENFHLFWFSLFHSNNQQTEWTTLLLLTN